MQIPMTPKLKEALEKYQKNEIKSTEVYAAITQPCEEGERLRKEFAEIVSHSGRLGDPSWQVYRDHASGCETCRQHFADREAVTKFMDRLYVWAQDDNL